MSSTIRAFPHRFLTELDLTRQGSAAELQLMLRENFEYFEQRVAVDTTLATALPPVTSAVLGDEVTVLASASAGVVWRFVLLQPPGVASPRWYFVGGPPLFSEVATAESRGNTAYAALTTPGPSLTIPDIAGDYDVEVGCKMFSAGNVTGHMSYTIAGAAAVDTDSFRQTMVAGESMAGGRPRRKTLAAGTALAAQYRGESATSVSYERRWMRVTPVSVA